MHYTLARPMMCGCHDNEDGERTQVAICIRGCPQTFLIFLLLKCALGRDDCDGMLSSCRRIFNITQSSSCFVSDVREKPVDVKFINSTQVEFV